MGAEDKAVHVIHAALGAALAVLVGLAMPADAQEGDPQEVAQEAMTTPEEVRTEVGDAMDALADYTVEKRDEALDTLDGALDTIDEEIARREQFLREGYADMSDALRAQAASALANMRTARNDLGESYGALQAGADDAWSDLKDSVDSAWDDLRAAWSENGSQEG